MFVAAAALATAACGAEVHSTELPQTMVVAAGDEPEVDPSKAGANNRQLRASLMADAARLAQLDATTSLRTSALGDALVQSIERLGLDPERREFLAAAHGLPAVSLRVDGDFVLAAGMIYSAVGVVEGPLRQAEVDDEGRLRGSGYDGAVVLIARVSRLFGSSAGYWKTPARRLSSSTTTGPGFSTARSVNRRASLWSR